MIIFKRGPKAAHRPPGEHGAGRKTLAAMLALGLVGALSITGAGSAFANPDGAHTGYGFNTRNGSYFGTYRTDTGQVAGCSQPGAAEPVAGISYAATADNSEPQIAYEAYRYMNVNDGVTGAAMEHIIQHSSYNIGGFDAGLDGDYAANDQGVLTKGNAITAEGARYKGPYTETVTITQQPTAANPNGAGNVVVKAASGKIMPGQTFRLSGATGIQGAVSSGGNAASLADGSPANFTFTATNGQSGTVTATDSALPATSVTLLAHLPASDNYQRLVASGSPTSARGTAAYARPAAPVVKSYVEVVKTDAQTGKPLAGATFHVNIGGTNYAVGTTNAQGIYTTPALNLAPGTAVTVTETAAPAGYDAAAAVGTKTVAAASTKTAVTIKDNEQSKVSIAKTDPNGKPLAGATFQVHAGGPTASVLATITTDAAGNATSPYLNYAPGTLVTLVESAPPAGFVAAPNAAVKTSRDGSGAARYTVADQRSVAGQIAVEKVDSVTNAVLPGAVFTLSVQKGGTGAFVPVTGGPINGTTETTPGHYTTAATGKAAVNGNSTSPKLHLGDTVRFTEVQSAPGHIISGNPAVTGAIGSTGTLVVNAANQPFAQVHLVKYQSGSSPHTYLPGATFQVSRMVGGVNQVLTTATTDANGDLNWAATGNESPAVLVGDTLTFTETSAPAGYTASAPVNAMVADYAAGPFENETLGAEAAARVAVADTAITPSIGTSTSTSGAGKNVVAGGTATDTIAYHELTPDTKYTVKGTIEKVNADGSVTATSNTSSGTFTTPAATNADGTSDGTGSVVFAIPADLTSVAGQTWVVYEDLYDATGTTPVLNISTGKPVVHEDAADTDQFLYVPAIGTTAANANADHGKMVVQSEQLTDVVAYSGLQPGVNYVMTGDFRFSDDGSDTGITGSQTFTPTATSGSVTVNFDVPAGFVAANAGRSIVAFETLGTNGDTSTTVAVHNDITDQGETVVVPKIGTTAANGDTSLGKVATAGTLTDTIHYSGLTPDKSYTATGVFQDVVGGQATPTGITGSATFTPAQSEGDAVVTFTVPQALLDQYAGDTLVAFETVAQGGVTIAVHADVNDQGQTIYVPKIGTTATSANADLGKIAALGANLQDTVAYSGLQPGVQYSLSGVFMASVNGAAPVSTGIIGATVFTPTASSGTAVVNFPVDSALLAKYAGQQIVAFETLQDSGSIIAIHQDITDKGQTVSVPSIGTTAANAVPALGKTVTAGTLTDTVRYANLIPGKTYTATGVFQDVTNGKATSTGITGSATFTPTESSGSAVVNFQVPASVLDQYAGDTLVAFETVAQGGVTIAVHADVNDQGQSVYVPKIGTTVANGDHKSGQVATSGGTVIDTVRYSNLVVGTTYTVSGEFQSVAGGKAVPTGIKGSTTFTPTATSGTVDVSFPIPADLSRFSGQGLVAFETITQGSNVVSINANINDTAETVYVPGIGTTAANGITAAGKLVTAGGTLTDTVHYAGVVPGKTYVVSGEFQNVVNGKAVPTGIKGSTTFTPKSNTGDAVVTFAVPANLSADLGQTWVAFETMTLNGTTVAIHADVTDKAQTVFVPKIGTTATNADSKLDKVVTAGGKLTDTIAYSNLQVGKSYTVKGEFQAIEAGKAVPTGVIGQASFTPTSASGTVVVTFSVPAALNASLTGTSWVAFETVYAGSAVVAIHADVTDAAQTVFAPKIGTSLYGPNGTTSGPNVVVDAQGGATLNDSIGYQGLQPGVAYVASGTLVNAQGVPTGVTGRMAFTPTLPNGTVKVPFVVPAHLLASGQELVVAFEKVALVSSPTVPVAVHQDIKAQSQQLTLSFGGGGTTVNSGGNGAQIPTGLGAEKGPDMTLVWTGLGILALLIGGAGVLIAVRRREDEADPQ